MNTLFEHLLSYAKKNRISFAMPGHKGGAGLFKEFKKHIAEIDVTELSDTENLHAPKSVIKTAQKKLSDIYGSEESYFLTGGSTEGVHIMVYSAVRNGRLLVNRNCHRSVINCAVLAGFDLVFIPQELDRGLNCPMPPSAEAIDCILKREKNIDAVMITSPDYYGHIADVDGIARVCHSYNLPLLVDEAHGAHFAAFGMPKGAIKSGADMAVQSAHKTLNALNQAALLHIKSGIINLDTVRSLTTMAATSSPSYPIVASAEMAVEELSGKKWLELSDYITAKKNELLECSKIIYPIGKTDPARIVFGLGNYNITGYEAEDILREKYNIDVEMSDRFNVVCIATPSNTFAEIDSLFDAIKKILAETEEFKGKSVELPVLPERVMPPREAFWSKYELVPLENAEGRIARTNIAAYPPGIAVVCYGEVITREIIDYITHIRELGAEIEGLDNIMVSVIAE
ncbi:MAG: aminotransferase class I/II-fold pyridoxal phosphate-dependent enzyme [Clostridia bacterium]|nr:aminotransferase class I/II-fold pyridoxal phosphate-dependent enzyme [Clostridia bacterium]